MQPVPPGASDPPAPCPGGPPGVILRSVLAPSVESLRLRHRGPVLSPTDAGYDPARATFNGMLDRRPVLITRPLDIADVVSAVTHAVEADLPIAVRGGGHSVTGHCVGDGSVVVALRLLREVHVDHEARTATCGCGASAGDLLPAWPPRPPAPSGG